MKNSSNLMIKNIVFDLGGVIFKIDKNQAIRRFKEVGFDDAASYLDAFTQVGIFGDLESGRINAEQFRCQLSEFAGKDLTLEDCAYGWQGYVVELPQRILDKLIELRQRGFRLSLLSNTNPFMMQWARSNAFDGRGHGLDHYFDALYLSYEMGVMKPENRIFEMMLLGENAKPQETVFIDDSAHNTEVAASMGIHVLQPDNGADWHEMLEDLISRCNS